MGVCVCVCVCVCVWGGGGGGVCKALRIFSNFLLNLLGKIQLLAYHGHFPPCAGPQTNEKTDVKKRKEKRSAVFAVSMDSHHEVKVMF